MGNSVDFVDIPSMERTPQAAHTYSEYETEPVRSSNPVGDTNMPEPAVIFIITVVGGYSDTLGKPSGSEFHKNRGRYRKIILGHHRWIS